MSSSLLIFILPLSLLSLLRGVSGCSECEDKAVFNPSTLIVKHGDPAFAECSLCPSCPNNNFKLEFSVGRETVNDTTILWTVDEMTQWKTGALCYYTDRSNRQCCSTLPVLVYKPPDSVSITLRNHSGPMFEGQQYTLHCEVNNVAPLGKANVTFYRGAVPLRHMSQDYPGTKPVTKVFSLSINTSRDDDGAQYWCEAKLELGPEGPQPPPVVTSQNITATVHYKPWRQEPAQSDSVTLTQGDPLELNCTAEGNPRPSYSWTVPHDAVPSSNSSVLTISSVDFEHEGRYICNVSNDVGTHTVVFDVFVQANILPYLAVAIVVLVVGMLIGVAYFYKHNRRGQYNLKDVFRLPRRHVAVPTAE